MESLDWFLILLGAEFAEAVWGEVDSDGKRASCPGASRGAGGRMRRSRTVALGDENGTASGARGLCPVWVRLWERDR